MDNFPIDSENSEGITDKLILLQTSKAVDGRIIHHVR